MTFFNLIRRGGSPNREIRQVIADEIKNEINQYYEFKRKDPDWKPRFERLSRAINLYELHRVADSLEILAGVWDDENPVSDENKKPCHGLFERSSRKKDSKEKRKGVQEE